MSFRQYVVVKCRSKKVAARLVYPIKNASLRCNLPWLVLQVSWEPDFHSLPKNNLNLWKVDHISKNENSFFSFGNYQSEFFWLHPGKNGDKNLNGNTWATQLTAGKFFGPEW